MEEVDWRGDVHLVGWDEGGGVGCGYPWGYLVGNHKRKKRGIGWKSLQRRDQEKRKGVDWMGGWLGDHLRAHKRKVD